MHAKVRKISGHSLCLRWTLWTSPMLSLLIITGLKIFMSATSVVWVKINGKSKYASVYLWRQTKHYQNKRLVIDSSPNSQTQLTWRLFKEKKLVFKKRLENLDEVWILLLLKQVRGKLIHVLIKLHKKFASLTRVVTGDGIKKKFASWLKRKLQVFLIKTRDSEVLKTNWFNQSKLLSVFGGKETLKSPMTAFKHISDSCEITSSRGNLKSRQLPTKMIFWMKLRKHWQEAKWNNISVF